MDYTPLPVSTELRGSLISNSIVAFVAVLVVILRCIARLVAGARLGWDDYLMLAALPQGLGLLVCLALWAPTGLGGADSPMLRSNFPHIFTILLPFQLLFVFCIVTVKLSVLIFYCRVFTSKSMRMATKLTIALVVAWGLGNFLQTLLVCHIGPGGKWVLLNGGCSSLAPSNLATGIFNCATNLIIALLPIYTIWSLPRVSVSTRLHLCAVFLLSMLVAIVSIVRIWFLTKTMSNVGSIDDMPTALLLTAIEANISIVVNSLPMLLPLYTWWKHRRFWGEGADDYVSRLRGVTESGRGADDNEEGITQGRPAGGRNRSAVEDLVNGVPLETIYGVDHVHFTATVVRGGGDTENSKAAGETIKMKTIMRTRSGRRKNHHRGHKKRTFSDVTDMDAGDDDDYECNASESESMRGLPGHAQRTGHAGIQIETKWSITEETVGPRTKPD